ncbi:uncharacterized protein EI97DRAFT_324440 [Westerdykella ornata]|uniref:F-box domain-containing protein n=1 Tax=Westerdykella ornata TaxID=318751 RepID=A0A6A6JJQ8_WESOR|nr:uncharacterized protein EI97DRAFT_324440 [Westerdykella ornata]KAF2276880.1 hypothetical protein EI97DRAFT_324440 [Westerdykella ornata]
MDQIPPEILANIINCLGGEEKLTPYASVSRQFRSGIERRTFRTLSHLKSTDLDFLSAAFLNHPLRRTYLKFLCLTVVLPPLQACCPVTQIPDRDADSATYSAAVRKLFSILRKIDDVVGDIGQDGLELCFATVDPPSYSSHRIWCRTHNRRDIVGAIARSGRITLAGADELPFLRGVGLFLFMGSHDFSFVEPGVSLEVAGKMPDFSSLVVYLRDSFTLGRVRRIAERQRENSCKPCGATDRIIYTTSRFTSPMNKSVMKNQRFSSWHRRISGSRIQCV